MKRRILIDHNTNKQLRHYDVEGDYIRLSVDETIARGLNKWKHWSCSAGMKNIYIDYDGNVWVCNTASSVVDRFNYDAFNKVRDEIWSKPATQEVRNEYEQFKNNFTKQDISVRKLFENEKGLLGTIYDGIKLPSSWYNCEWNICACGADVFIPKAKHEHSDKLFVNKSGRNAMTHNLVNELDTEVVAVEPNFPIPYQILWDLGRFCNYECSYCWPSVHNRDAPHKPLKLMVDTANYLIDNWSSNEKIRWNFGGGEPTLNPDFISFLKHLNERNQWVLVTTNGSRPRKYWSEAIKYINSINLSVHLEFVTENKLLGNIEEICNHFNAHNDDHWLEIKLMAKPSFVQKCVDLQNKIKSITPLGDFGANGRINGFISIVPIRGDSGELLGYTDEELKIIQNQ